MIRLTILLACWLAVRAGLWRVVGWNPAEVDGIGVADGLTGRIVNPTTGGGIFNPNLNPAIVGIDPLTGSLAPEGTDMSFAAPVRRQIQTNVINGDFATLPPGGAGSPIDSNPASATYNPLDGWTWSPPSDGRSTASVVADAAYGSGYKFQIVVETGGATTGVLKQLVPVPISQGQQYRVLPSLYAGVAGSGTILTCQFVRADGVTTIGSAMSGTSSGLGAEVKLDAGLVPPLAAYVLLSVGVAPGPSSSAVCGEVRCAFLPVEATLGLKSNTANVGAITTTETQVCGITIPANTLTVGSVYEIDAWGNVTSSAGNVVTFRIRIGTTTLTGNIPEQLAPTATATAANNSFHLTGRLTVRSVGAGGTIIGSLQFIGQDTQPFTVRLRASQATATVAVNTTVANILELTAQTAAGTTSVTFQQATIACVMAS